MEFELKLKGPFWIEISSNEKFTTPFQILSVLDETAKQKHYFDLISNKYVKKIMHISYQNLHMGGLNQYYSVLAMRHSIIPQIASIFKLKFVSNEIYAPMDDFH